MTYLLENKYTYTGGESWNLQLAILFKGAVIALDCYASGMGSIPTADHLVLFVRSPSQGMTKQRAALVPQVYVMGC